MSDLSAGREEIARDLNRAYINLEGLLQRGEEIPDIENLRFALVALGCVIDYVEGGNDE